MSAARPTLKLFMTSSSTSPSTFRRKEAPSTKSDLRSKLSPLEPTKSECLAIATVSASTIKSASMCVTLPCLNRAQTTSSLASSLSTLCGGVTQRRSTVPRSETPLTTQNNMSADSMTVYSATLPVSTSAWTTLAIWLDQSTAQENQSLTLTSEDHRRFLCLFKVNAIKSIQTYL